MGWTKAIAAADLPADARQVVSLDGQKVLLLNHEGTIHAVANSCPHMKLPMKKGKIVDGALVCPFHRSAFDLCSGTPQSWTPFPPGVGKVMGMIKSETPLPVFATKVEDGEIWVEVGTAA